MTAVDLNGDGKPDIVVSHLFESAVSVLRNTAIPPVQLNAVVSRKTHGSAGTFGVDLTNGNGIECRSGGTSGDYTLAFSFADPLTNVNGAPVSSGNGTVSSSAIDGGDPRNYIVNLTGISNIQRITVSLTNVSDSIGDNSNEVTASMGVLIWDVNSTAALTNADVSSVKAQVARSGSVDATNFRTDVNANGGITNARRQRGQSASSRWGTTAAVVFTWLGNGVRRPGRTLKS